MPVMAPEQYLPKQQRCSPVPQIEASHPRQVVVGSKEVYIGEGTLRVRETLQCITM